ncbi:uncharacterized protein LOC134943405 [Pseudophryne corroboree]|uniref:uncharacterized protein LOC134943405 n=1 Tax=Pseudophryne corroboree TaxID=495146 RepID=UPI00308200A4
MSQLPVREELRLRRTGKRGALLLLYCMSLDQDIDFITGLLEMYCGHECLWNIIAKGYSDKVRWNAALEELVEYCRPFVSSADKDWVKKKIQNLRTVFLKEHKKKEQSKRSGAGSSKFYKTSLWYYPMLEFVLDQEPTWTGFTSIPRTATSEPEDDELSLSASSESVEIPTTPDLSLQDTEESQNQDPTPEAPATPDTPAAPAPPPRPRKRTPKKYTSREGEDLIFEEIKARLAQPPDHYKKCGEFLASAICNLPPSQAEQIEYLTLKMLNKARKSQLHDKVILIDCRPVTAPPTQPHPIPPTQPHLFPPTQPHLIRPPNHSLFRPPNHSLLPNPPAPQPYTLLCWRQKEDMPQFQIL